MSEYVTHYPRSNHLLQLLKSLEAEHTNSLAKIHNEIEEIDQELERLQLKKKHSLLNINLLLKRHVEKVDMAYKYCKKDEQLLVTIPDPSTQEEEDNSLLTELQHRFSSFLYPYQMACIFHMMKVAQTFPDAIKFLGNVPGTGKTRMALIFAWTALRARAKYSRKRILIIVPAKLIQHWKKESNLIELMQGVEIVFYGNVYSLRRDSLGAGDDSKKIYPAEVISYNCFLKYSKECARYLNDQVYTLIFDENETRDGSDFFWHKTNCDHWVISGTYKDNKAWSYIQDKVGYDTVVHASSQFIDKSYTLPPITSRVIRCKGLDPQIRQFLPHETLSLLNQGDTAAALRSVLSDDTNDMSEQSVIRAHTNLLERNIQNCKKQVDYWERQPPSSISQAALVEWQSKQSKNETLRQNIIERIKDTLCPICYTDNVDAPVIITKCCVRRICLTCLMRTLSIDSKKSKCPWCRCWMLSADTFSVIQVQTSNSVVNVEPVPHFRNGTKAEALLSLIQQEPNESWLIVSENEHCFQLQDLLRNKHFQCNTLQGTTEQVQEMIDQHAIGAIQILFLNRLAFGVGVHLAHVTRILFYHVFSTLTEYKQGIARAQRLGRTLPLVVYHLVTNDEEVDKSIL